MKESNLLNTKGLPCICHGTGKMIVKEKIDIENGKFYTRFCKSSNKETRDRKEDNHDTRKHIFKQLNR